MTLLDFNKQFPGEQACQDYLEQMRWADGRYCPHCGSYETYKFKDGRLFKCSDCKKQFTVKVGTIFSDSHVPLQKWFYAVYLNTSLKKGISSIQLAKYLGITQKSAWFMLQRIRYSVAHGTFDKPLEGTVEVDETYVGGFHHGQANKYDNKVAVIGIVEKKKKTGRIRTTVTKRADATVALPFIKASLKQNTVVHTDESRIYNRLKRDFIHDTVNRSQKEFVRENVSTQQIDGAWSHLKAGLDAIYVGVSAKHLPLYCNEFDYRYNTRELTDGQRFDQWFKFINGKRLTYKNLIS
jgi:transposase-like protein